jgi:hypothetical protein
MLFGVLKMPYEMAMSSEISRLQFYMRAQELVAKVEAQPAQEPVSMYEDWYNPNSCGHCGMVGGHIDTCKLYASPPQRQPLTDEQDRALCEAYCNDASDEYFKARPVLDFPEMRRIFYAGHRKAWITREAAHGIKGTT